MGSQTRRSQWWSGLAASIGVVEFASDKLRPNFERFSTRLYAARAKEVGWQRHPGEDENIELLRRS